MVWFHIAFHIELLDKCFDELGIYIEINNSISIWIPKSFSCEFMLLHLFLLGIYVEMHIIISI